MLCGMYKNTVQAQLTSILDLKMARGKDIGNTSVNMVGNCGRKLTFDDYDAHALVRYVRKNRRATLPQVTENVTAGRDQTLSARTVHCLFVVLVAAQHRTKTLYVSFSFSLPVCI
uniref:Uncharacterized protein n=1 Tax=Anguilla anguilla TaxID=7936 RepID=A0A0E9WFX9_ANGAN